MATPGQSRETQNRPYQGYPYVNPAVIDVPSVDQATAAKWANLPRRPLGPVRNDSDQASERPRPSQRSESSNEFQVNTSNRSTTSPVPSRSSEENSPVVYIELPNNGSSYVVEHARDVTERSETDRTETTREPTFVEETILYDPFKNRRIDLTTVRSDETESTSTNSSINESYPSRIRPNQPNTLGVTSPGSSSGYTMSPTFGSSSNQNLPGFMSKEANYYGRQPIQEDGFSLTPLPVDEFPEPPPAYTEFDRVNTTGATTTTPGAATPPPRTEVITSGPNIPIGPDRKLLICPRCNQRVHSLVVRESGAFTHILALILTILCLIPIVVFVYCIDYFKYKNHYCPNCNHLIGYEIPILCQQLVLVK